MHEIDLWIGALPAVMQALGPLFTAAVRTGLSQKLLIHQSIYIPTLTPTLDGDRRNKVTDKSDINFLCKMAQLRFTVRISEQNHCSFASKGSS